MMTTIQIRTDEKTKKAAQKAFKKMGLDMSSGIKLYLARVAVEQRVPFELHVPNAETIAAIRALEAGGGERFDSVEALMEDALGKNWRKKSKRKA